MLPKKITFFILEIIPLSLLAQTYTVDTIFITASRVTSQIEKLPVAVNIISEEVIRLKGFGDFSGIFSGIEGIDFRNYTFLKGLSSLSLLGSTSQQVLVLVDGIPFYSPATGTPDLGLIPTDNLKRIEILKGGASSLYGANALGGVVNFITKSPYHLKPRRLNILGELSGGNIFSNSLRPSFNTYLFNFTSGINGDDRTGFLFSLHREKTKGVRSNEDASTLGGSFSLAHLENLRLNFNYEEKEMGICGPKPPRETIPRYGDSTASSIYDRQRDNQYRIGGEISFAPSSNLKIKFSPFFNANRTRYQWVDQFSTDTAIYQDTYWIKTYGGNLTSTLAPEEMPLQIAGGIDFKRDDFKSHSYFYDLGTYSYKDTMYNPKGERVGLFLEGNFWEKPSLFSSFRYDWDKVFCGFFSPSFGITYPLPSGKFRFHLARAFRAPTFNDLYWPRSGNLSLKPEVGWTFQSGFDINPVSLTFFYRKTKDLIAWFPDTAGFWRPTNVDQQEVFGLEWEGKWLISHNILFSLSGDWKKATQLRKEMVYWDSFAEIKRRAAFLPSFKLSPSLLFRDTHTLLHLEGNFVGDKVNYYPAYDSFPKVYMKRKRLPSYFTLGLRLERRLISRLVFAFKAENLFDVTYAEAFGNTISDRDYPRPGRTIFFGLRLKD
ncbi:MAG: TonB-dependent receptor [candidate division WOR-3 bacterium]